MKCPCMGCPNRHISCHSKCNNYKEWLEQHIKENRKIKKETKKYRDYFYHK